MYAAGNLFGKAKFISFWSHSKVNIFMFLHDKVWYLLLFMLADPVCGLWQIRCDEVSWILWWGKMSVLNFWHSSVGYCLSNG